MNLNFAHCDGISLPGGKIAGTLLTAPLHLRFNFMLLNTSASSRFPRQVALLCLLTLKARYRDVSFSHFTQNSRECFVK